MDTYIDLYVDSYSRYITNTLKHSKQQKTFARQHGTAIKAQKTPAEYQKRKKKVNHGSPPFLQDPDSGNNIDGTDMENEILGEEPISDKEEEKTEDEVE